MVFPVMDPMTEGLSIPFFNLSSYHTTILQDGFYITLEDTNRVMMFQGFIECYGAIYNLMVDELTKIGVVDKFGRLKFSMDRTIGILEHLYGENQLDESLGDYFVRIFLNGGAASIPEYYKIFPQCILELPIYELEHHLLTNARVVSMLKEDRHFEISLPFNHLMKGNPNVCIVYDVTINRALMEIRMQNLYGNQICINIASNTNSTDKFFYGLYENKVYLNDMVLVIGVDQELLARSNKLLFTVKYHSEEEMET